tara:strand:+ start:2856 stop:3167 length:312 start_codon:yes stop_codon:yes gene_type:complete
MDEPREHKELTIDTCASCKTIFACEETNSFIYGVGLPPNILEEAEDHTHYLCVDCMKERISDLHSIYFASVYEIKLLEKIIIYEGDDPNEEKPTDSRNEDYVP